MIVVDGRTDDEKLRELLGAGAEETALDFKSTLNLASGTSKDSLEFVKDAVSMGNLPTGGYICVGVDDRGRPAHDQAEVVADQFDSAKLRERVLKYVEAPVNIFSQAHQVDGRTVILIFIAPNNDGLPVPLSAIGQYDRGGGRMEIVFSPGEVLLREGTSNVRLRYAHWNSLLARYREMVRAEASSDSNALIRRVLEGIGDSGTGRASVPLDPGMDDATMSDALVALFDSGSTVRVQQFLNDAGMRAAAGGPDDRAERAKALDQIALVACQAVVYRNDGTFELAVEALDKAYKARLLSAAAIEKLGSDRSRAEHYLDVMIRVLALGALAVRVKAWELLKPLSARPVVESGYEWGSWLRHAVTMASRAGLLQKHAGREQGGQVLSLARSLAADSPALRPDYRPDTPLPLADELAHDDWLLNSLCEFDMWWCIIAVASRPQLRDGSSYYPSCAAFHQWRSQPTLEHIGTEPDVRRTAFGDISDQVIADATLTVVDMAVQQSHQYGGWWDGFERLPQVAEFIYQNATTQPG